MPTWQLLDLKYPFTEASRAPERLEVTVSGKFTEVADQVVSGIALIREGVPEAMKAFTGLSIAATVPKALDAKTKELIALAIGIAVHCDGYVRA